MPIAPGNERATLAAMMTALTTPPDRARGWRATF